jgi:hypothetical protein
LLSMTILATGARPNDIEPGGVGPLIRVAGKAHDAFMRILAKGAASGSQRGRVEEFERSAKLITAFGLRMEVFEEVKLIAGQDEVVQVA